MALHLHIVTPEKQVFSDTVDNVYLPGAEGEIGILDGHAALVTSLAPGELRYAKGGSVTSLALGSGFAEVTQHNVNVLTDMALNADQIDTTKAETALKRAKEKLDSLSHSDDAEEVAHLQGVIAKSTVQLRLKGHSH